ncbi:energy transducer TonB [Niveispirillum sp. BGYR6]|uniref:energy transducer TonB n=1 Tax=Niveispirillum sp. BGYR6 TaxID=2971249 RepID=UPI0022B98C62|nr:energy transducer TonB [Niveispirillum sp. BGYR6]MDG5497730.1 energy transducer TonB [Niveispirillum sp. BGYR6]
MRTPLLFKAILAILLFSPAAADAQIAPTASHEHIDLGKKVCKDSQFPQKERGKTGEGWVSFRTKLQEDGKLTDFKVIANAGNKVFVETALKNFSKCAFIPSVDENGKVVYLENIYFNYVFLQPDLQKNKEVNEKLEAIRQLIKEGKIEEANSSLETVEQDANRFVDLIDISLLYATLMKSKGRDDIALRYLQMVPVLDEPIESDPNAARVLSRRLDLELKMGLLASAEVTSSRLAKAKPLPENATLLAELEKLRQLGASGQPMAITGRVPAECRPMICDPAKPSWEYVPVHRTVSLADAKGRLDQVILRCTRRTVTIPATTGNTWTLPAKLGQCAVEVTGEPGATFTLIDETLPG